MGDYNPLGVSGLIRPERPSRPERRGLTDYEQNLRPYYQAEQGERREEANKLKPVQWIFDRLQTGQYVSANITNEIMDILDNDPETVGNFGQAVWEGITGERKGSYTDILDRAGVLQGNVFQNAKEGGRLAEMKYADLAGFVGDVLLDPTTYLTFGIAPGVGTATKAAQNAAQDFAEDSVRLMLKQVTQDPSLLARFAPNKMGVIEEAATGSRKLIREMMGRSDDLGMLLDVTYRQARDAALSRTGAELAGEMSEGIAKVGSEGLEGVMERLSGRGYAGAGEHSARFLGKEFMQRGPGAQERGWEKFKNVLRPNPEKSDFRSAMWGMMNRGVVGELRQMFGFRNPYQKAIRARELEVDVGGTRIANEELMRSMRVLDEVPEEDLTKIVDFFAAKQDAKLGAREGASITQDIGVDMQFGPEVSDAAYKLKEVLDSWNMREGQWAKDLVEDPAKYMDWYLPGRWRQNLNGAADVRKTAKYSINQRVDQEVNKLKFIFGMDDQKARQIVNSNSTNLITDVKELVAGRAIVHGKAKSRHDMLLQFKEMGINLNDAADPAAQKLIEGGAKLNLNQIGLNSVNHPAFEGHVFDDDVADIINRTLTTTGQDANLFKRGMAKFSSWWKGIVTMTTGFHARNFMSNTTTQFLRHGPRAFNFKEQADSIAAVAYALRKSNPKKFLTEIGIDDSWIAKHLNNRYGQYTVRELADEALSRGAISENTMGFDPQDLVEKMGQQKKLLGGGLRDASRNVGQFLENVPRFQSFLIDYSDLATQVIPEGVAKEVYEKTTLDWAARQAKKWFLDYSDLTQFEQKTMKSIVPFYTWIRKNLANQIDGVALYPELYSIMPKIEDLARLEDPDYDPEMVPEWMREEGMFPIAQREGTMRMFRPDFAHMDLNLIPLAWQPGKLWPELSGEQLRDELINATAPWIRRTADRLRGAENPYNYFYKDDYGPKAEAPYVVRLLASRPGVMPILDGMLRKMGYEDGAGFRERDGRVEVDSLLVAQLESFLPVLRQLEFVFYLPQMIPSLKNGLDSVISNASAQNKYEDTEMMMQQLGFWLGIKTMDIDLQEERSRIGYDILTAAQSAYNDDRSQLPGAEQRSLEWRQRTNDQIRRLQ